MKYHRLVTLAQVALGVCLFAGPDAGPKSPRSWLDPARCQMQVQLQALGSVVHARHSWKAMHFHFRKFGQCDDGPIAEGYSDDVVTLLAHKWNLVGELASLGRTDPTFLQFVLAHIDGTTAPEDLQAVRSNAQDACPPGHARLCRLIAGRAKGALEEQTGPGRK